MKKYLVYGLASIAAVIMAVCLLFGSVAFVGAIFTVLFWSADFLFGTQFCTPISVGVATLVFLCLRMLFDTRKD